VVSFTRPSHSPRVASSPLSQQSCDESRDTQTCTADDPISSYAVVPFPGYSVVAGCNVKLPGKRSSLWCQTCKILINSDRKAWLHKLMLADANELNPSSELIPVLFVHGITKLMLPAIQANPC